jgi:hypothetical protein
MASSETIESEANDVLLEIQRNSGRGWNVLCRVFDDFSGDRVSRALVQLVREGKVVAGAGGYYARPPHRWPQPQTTEMTRRWKQPKNYNGTLPDAARPAR